VIAYQKSKQDPQKQTSKKGLFSSKSAELYTTSPPNETIGLKGILGIGQSLELSKRKNQIQSQGKELFNSVSHLQRESETLFRQGQQQLKKELNNLREEIKKLIGVTKNLNKDIQIASQVPITETNTYQLNFLSRLKNFIANFRKNMSKAHNSLEIFNARTKKRRKIRGKGRYWENVTENGQQYMYSGEHSASRSA